MTSQEPSIDAEPVAAKPRKPRRAKTEGKASIFRQENGSEILQGTFLETFFGTPFERSLYAFVRDTFGAGDYRVVVTKPNGQYSRTFPLSVADARGEREIEMEADRVDEDFEDAPDEYAFLDRDAPMTQKDFENALMRERLKQVEAEALRQRQSSQTETQAFLAALEAHRKENREMTMMLIQLAQKPQQDSSLTALDLMEKSFGLVNKARAFSEEIAPSGGSSEGGGGFLDGAAKVIESVGRHAPTFMPIVAGMMQSAASQPPAPQPGQMQHPGQAPPPVTTNPGELANLADRVQKKGKEQEVSTK